MLLHLLSNISWWIVLIPWMVARFGQNAVFAKGTRQHAVCSRIKGELMPFVLPAVVITGAWGARHDEGAFDYALTILFVAVWAWDWAIAKDDDDDNPWRRRGRRLRDRLTSRTPATAGGAA